jgi:hypothetical protein
MSGIQFHFKPFDDSIMDKHDIDSRAKDDAGFEIPTQTSLKLSPAEVAITREIESFYSANLQTTNRAGLEDKLQSNESLRKADGHSGQISSLEIDLNALYLKNKAILTDLYSKYKKDSNFLSFFQKENKLYEPATLKSSSAKTLAIIIVTAMFLFESSVNTGFLTGSISGGILGALSLAGVVSFINIVASFLLGRFVIPNLLHVKKSRVNFSRLVLLFYTPLVIYINCALGVFRSLSQAATETFNSEKLAEAALQAAWPFNDFGTNSVESNALIIIGLLFAVIAILDGFYFDEPYPSYGNVTKKANESEATFNAAKEKTFDLLYAKQKAGNDQLTDYKDKRAKANLDWAFTIDSVQAGFSAYPSWVNSLRKKGNSFLNSYRAENKRYRNTPEPAYFADEFEFDFVDDPNIQFRSLVSANIEDSEKEKSFNTADNIITSEYNDAIKKVNEIYSEINANFDRFLQELSR